MPSRRQLYAAFDAAYKKLSDIAFQDAQGGSITALSYLGLDHWWPEEEKPEWLREELAEHGYTDEQIGGALIIRTSNIMFNGDPEPLIHELGELEDGAPVIWIEEDRGIVTGKMGLGPVLELFGR